MNTLDAVAAKTNLGNNFTECVGVETSNMNTNVPGMNIVARTDLNQYARPTIALNCKGTISAILYLDIDSNLKVARGSNIYTVNLTKIN